MFARSVIRRQTYSDVIAKSAAHTVNPTGEGSGKSFAIIGFVAGTLLAGFGLNRLTPSTQPAAGYYQRFCSPTER